MQLPCSTPSSQIKHYKLSLPFANKIHFQLKVLTVPSMLCLLLTTFLNTERTFLPWIKINTGNNYVHMN